MVGVTVKRNDFGARARSGHSKAPMTPDEIARSGTESAHQMAFFQWIALEGSMIYPGLHLMHAIPNGGDRRPEVGARMRAEGVKRGVPDTFLPLPKGRWHGLYIEFKRPSLIPDHYVLDVEHGGYLNDGRSDEQRKMGRELLRHGYAVVVAYNWQQAVGIVRDYLAQSEAPNKSIDEVS